MSMQKTNIPSLDVGLIPNNVKEQLIVNTLRAFRRAMADPETRTMIKARTAARVAQHDAIDLINTQD